MSRVKAVVFYARLPEILEDIRKEHHVRVQVEIVVLAEVIDAELPPHILRVLVVCLRDTLAG